MVSRCYVLSDGASELRLNGISLSPYAEMIMSVEGRSLFLAI